jgi:hypothetical protein
MFQFISSEDTEERDPIENTFHYLFLSKEPEYGELYERDSEEKKLYKEFHQHIKNKYKDAKEYVNRVEMMLFLKFGELVEYISIAEKAWKTPQKKETKKN